MSAVPAAYVLTDFSLEDAPKPWLPARADAQQDAAAAEADKVARAFEEGLAQGRSETLQTMQDKLEEQRQAFEQQLAERRAAWCAEIGETLAGQLTAAVAQMEANLADVVARVLKPFVAAELHRQIMGELQACLDALVSTDAAVRLEITGPADVLEQVRGHLAGKAVSVTYTPGADCDVRVVAGPAVIETQLKSWLAKLDEAVP